MDVDPMVRGEGDAPTFPSVGSDDMLIFGFLLGRLRFDTSQNGDKHSSDSNGDPAEDQFPIQAQKALVANVNAELGALEKKLEDEESSVALFMKDGSRNNDGK